MLNQKLEKNKSGGGVQNRGDLKTNPHELQAEIENARNNEEEWSQKWEEVTQKQYELTSYEDSINFAKRKFNETEEYKEKYKDLLNEEIITFTGIEKMPNEMISFKNLGAYENEKLIHDRDIVEVAVNVMRAYDSNYNNNKNPQKIFTYKKETTLNELFSEYKIFLEGLINKPKPTQEEINSNQNEVNIIWESYKKSIEEVKKLEAQIEK